jgi:hypothetical protein
MSGYRVKGSYFLSRKKPRSGTAGGAEESDAKGTRVANPE